MEPFNFDDGPPAPAPFKKTLTLTIELVPSTSWGDNLRSRLPRAQWDRLRKAQYKRANYCCEICGGRGREQGFNWPVECHEVWHYDDVNHIQTLERLIALCPRCHQVKHIGRTIAVKGWRVGLGLVSSHIRKVNGWSKGEVDAHIEQAYATHIERSKHPWTLDLSALGSSAVAPE